MATDAIKTKQFLTARFKLFLVSLMVAGAGLVSTVSAVAIDLSGITDLIDEVVLIMPAMVAMIIAAIPIIIILAIAAFILGFLDSIVKSIKGG
jgi:hypothetical protein